MCISIDRVGVETEQERVNVRVKNFFIFGVYYFWCQWFFGLSTSYTELALRVKKLTRGLYGSEVFERIF